MELFGIKDIELELKNAHDTVIYVGYPDHWLKERFDNAAPLIKHFDYDLSLLDKKDIPNYIRMALEPEIISLIEKLKITDIYINENLYNVFEYFNEYTKVKGSQASDFSCEGHLGITDIQVCHKNYFDDNFILLHSYNGNYYTTFIKGF